MNNNQSSFYIPPEEMIELHKYVTFDELAAANKGECEFV